MGCGCEVPSTVAAMPTPPLRYRTMRPRGSVGFFPSYSMMSKGVSGGGARVRARERPGPSSGSADYSLTGCAELATVLSQYASTR